MASSILATSSRRSMARYAGAAAVLARRAPVATLVQAKPRSTPAFAATAAASSPASRSFSSASSAAAKVVKTLGDEIAHEEEQYKQVKEIQAFLKKSDFKLVDTEGDVNVALEREVNGRLMRIEWQLSSPFDPDADMEGEEKEEQDATDFLVTIEDKSSGAGMTFFCSTHTGEDHRYIIGNVKTFANTAEKESISAYNGPDFEDVDDKLQEALDEYLAEVGLSGEVCDMIDAVALDKEQREYIRWLKTVKSFLEA